MVRNDHHRKTIIEIDISLGNPELSSFKGHEL